MPFNLLKKYSDLLELVYMNEHQRHSSLMGVFKRDIEDNESFCFRTKPIRPIKKDGYPTMQTLFQHLTTRNEQDNKGEKLQSRIFEMSRSERLHWVKHHIDEVNPESVFVFSYEDRSGGKTIIRTYIYNRNKGYVIILEPQRSKRDYYLLTAYYLNEPGGKKQIEKKFKKKLPEVH